METLIARMVEQIVTKTHKNVTFHINEAPFQVFDVSLGHRIMITHGDTVFKTGNPGTSINMKNIKDQLNAVNSSLKDKKTVDVLFLGHVHTPTIQKLDNDAFAVINGCVSGLDPFANSVGIFQSNPTQQIIEMTRENAVGDCRFVSLKEADDNKELDKIIKPFNKKF
jgi:predicted phosphodiesterase